VVSFNCGDEREVGYWLGREYWGQGIATAALQEFLAVEQHRPLFAGVVDDNAGSIRVLEKCGFQLLRRERNHSAARGADIEELIFTLA
jgi:RimJ/RimL family protein N-acetyltransferase